MSKKKETRTYRDRRSYLINAVAKRRKKIRALAMQEKGGECCFCGYDTCPEALEFHHVNGKKDFGISSKGYTRSWKKVKAEIEKCLLVCANCHREVHTGIRDIMAVL